MTKRLSLVLCLMAVLISSQLTIAQDDTPTDWLVVQNNGQLWAFTDDSLANPILFENCGIGVGQEAFLSPMLLAPNGDHIAYQAQPVQVDLNRTLAVQSVPPTNIRICNGIDLADYGIGNQPDDFNAYDAGRPLHFRIHSNPTWSPDSHRIAWTFITMTNGDPFLGLFIHTVFARDGVVISTELPQQGGVLIPLESAWGESGIFVASQTTTGVNDDIILELLHFQDNGVLLNRAAMPTGGGRGFPFDFFIVDNQGTEAVVLVYSTGVIEVLDIANGTWSPWSGKLQAYAPEAPAGSLVLNYRIENEQIPIWEVETADGVTTRLDYGGLRLDHGIAIAPNGQSVAYVSDAVYHWENGVVETLPLQIDSADSEVSMVWSPILWRLVP